jgi:hypothetical protein
MLLASQQNYTNRVRHSGCSLNFPSLEIAEEMLLEVNIYGFCSSFSRYFKMSYLLQFLYSSGLNKIVQMPTSNWEEEFCPIQDIPHILI